MCSPPPPLAHNLEPTFTIPLSTMTRTIYCMSLIYQSLLRTLNLLVYEMAGLSFRSHAHGIKPL